MDAEASPKAKKNGRICRGEMKALNMLHVLKTNVSVIGEEIIENDCKSAMIIIEKKDNDKCQVSHEDDFEFESPCTMKMNTLWKEAREL